MEKEQRKMKILDNKNTLEQFPVEIVDHILSYLGDEDLRSVRGSCKNLQNITDKRDLYLFKKRMREAPKTGKINIKNVTGHAHTLILSDSGQVFGCGSNRYGELGLGHKDDVQTLKKIPIQTPIRKIFSGYFSSFAISESNAVYAWGKNDNYQLGLGDCEDRSSPSKFDFQFPSPVKDIACGHGFTVFLLEKGEIFVCGGDNSHCQLGNATWNKLKKPQHLDVLPAIKKIGAGDSFCLALTEDGDLFHWGKPFYDSKQSEHSYFNAYYPPSKDWIKVQISDFSVGTWHAMLYYNHCWHALGSLELGTSRCFDKLHKIQGLPDSIVQVESGFQASLFLSSEGKVYSIGQSRCDGNEIENNPLTAKEITTIKYPVENIFCGSRHSFASTKNGFFYGWGNNHEGRLLLPQNVRRVLKPHRILEDKLIKRTLSEKTYLSHSL